MTRNVMPDLVPVMSYDDMLPFFPKADSVRDLASFADKSGFIPISHYSPEHVFIQSIPLWGEYADFAFGRSVRATGAHLPNLSLDAPWEDDHEMLIIVQNDLPDVCWLRDDTLANIDAVRFVQLEEHGDTIPVYLVAYCKGQPIGALLETVAHEQMLRRIRKLEKVARRRDVHLHLCEGESYPKPGARSRMSVRPAVHLLDGLRHSHRVRWLPTARDQRVEIRDGDRMGFALVPPHMKRAARC